MNMLVFVRRTPTTRGPTFARVEGCPKAGSPFPEDEEPESSHGLGTWVEGMMGVKATGHLSP